ncbi:MAG: glycosyltransferase involved in cell wall biosynthesis [Desulforhopalus sp.]|jgi:glycosyltransferase involved in cell wall biosynthesis
MSICPVSVIIPTYNRANFLQRAIDSICNQTLVPAEIIVVDDGSTDNTMELLLAMKAKSKIPIISIHTDNHGVAAARNVGIQNGRYDIIAFLDSDDHWNRKKVEKQYKEFIKQTKYQICYTKEKWLRGGEHLNQKRKHVPRHGDIFSQCLELCSVGTSTVMVRKVLFEKTGYFDESMQCCEDYDLWLRLSVRHEFLLIDEPLNVKEGGRDDQLSNIYRLGMDERRIYSIEKLLSSGTLQNEQYNMVMQEFEKKIRIFANGCLKHGKIEDSKKYLELLRLCKNKKPKQFI